MAHQTSCSSLSPEVWPFLQLCCIWLTFVKYMLHTRNCLRFLRSVLQAAAKYWPKWPCFLIKRTLRWKQVLACVRLAAVFPPCCVWRTVKELDSQHVLSLRRAMACFGQPQGRKAMTCPFSVQGTLN